MKMTFRWYGEKDPVTLDEIRQIPGMTGVVTALYDTPAGSVWKTQSISRLKKLCNDNGLEMEVIESVPVHEDIKLGLSTRDKYIQNYCRNILSLGKQGVKCICYNFMPVFDWVRTDLNHVNIDGSQSLSYDGGKLVAMDAENLHLPGWDESYAPNELKGLINAYKSMTHEKLFDNLAYFLNAIMPACEESGINMAIHPDDPPWDLFGLPRIVCCEEDYDRLFQAVPDRHNGITFCTGSLGASRGNDLVKMAAKYAGRIYFAHLRQLKITDDKAFYENGHQSDSGDFDMYEIVKALVNNGFDGYVRPDHGRNIWGEHGKPGYGLYDRALGACYLSGLFEAVKKERK